MTRIQKWIIFGAAFLLVTNGTLYAVWADHDYHKEEKGEYQKACDRDENDDDRKHSKHHSERYLNPVDNAVYKETCRACHFVYQPGLLPSGSWEKILSGLEDHFGEAIELDPDSEKVIAEYLRVNAAERSSAKRAVRIVMKRSLKIMSVHIGCSENRSSKRKQEEIDQRKTFEAICWRATI